MKLSSEAATSSRRRTNGQPAVSEPIVDPPFAVAFETERADYIYDVGTNRLLRVRPEVAQALQRIHKAGWPENPEKESEVDSGLAGILKLREQGLLRSERPMALPLKLHRKCLEPMIRTSLSQLTLEITEVCNLRCRYCIYGAGYENQRPHGFQRMARETVDKGIDYFYTHNHASPFISLGFYGGEPLTAFDEIKRATALARSYPRGTDAHMHMTTNGTLLRREKFKFLVDNDFALTVSMDGPEGVHDCYRRTAGDDGTFRTIVENLKALREYAPQYFERKIMISAVHAPATSYELLLKFFGTSPLLRRQMVQVSGVSDGCPQLFEQLMRDVTDWNAVYKERNQLMQEYLQRILHRRTRGARFRFLHSLHAQGFVAWHRRAIYSGAEAACHINGMCIPGWRKLFVAADGTLFTCERVGRAWPIGHVDSGIDLDRVFEYLECHQKFHDKHCAGCWAKRVCGACMSTIGGPDGIDSKKVREFCDDERQRIADTIILHTRVLERDPHAWDFIEEITLS